jgi:MFS family permease
MMLLQAVMAWQVYDVTGTALSLGGLGLIRFLPALGMSMVGGAFADTYNRRTIILVAQTVPLTCASVLAIATFGGWVRLELIYGLVLLMGLASSFEGPARSALLPAIVPREHFVNAVTVSQTLMSFAMMAGPVLGAGIIALAGVDFAYAVFVALSLSSITTMALVRYRPSAERRGSVSLAAIAEGLRFVRQRQVLLGSMTLDMFAVIFGGATALLPVYATDILGVGALGYGILYSSLEIGAFAMSLVLLLRPPVVNSGRVLIASVLAYGLFTVLFGLSEIFMLSVALYMAIGAADYVSMVMRQTTIQLATPDELRGRVSSVASVFISASTHLGAVESGFVAALTSASFAVVSGGIGAMGVAALIGWRMPELLNYRISDSVTSAAPRHGAQERPSPERTAPAAGG